MQTTAIKLVRVARIEFGHVGAANDNVLGREWDRVGPAFRETVLFKTTAPAPRRSRFRGVAFDERA